MAISKVCLRCRPNISSGSRISAFGDRLPQIVTVAGIDFWTGDSIHTESWRKYDAQSFTRLAELGDWDVAELWTDADRLFAVFGLVAAEPAQGS